MLILQGSDSQDWTRIMTSHSLSQDPLVAHPVSASLARRVIDAIVNWRTRAEQRSALAHTPAWDRRDLGDADVWSETRKWPWQR